MELCNITGLKGKVTIPGDKSISHRCIMFGSIANGTTQIHNFLSGADCLATIRCFRELGIEIEVESDYSSVIVHGKGLHGLSAPEKILDVGNSDNNETEFPVFSPDSRLTLNCPEMNH